MEERIVLESQVVPLLTQIRDDLQAVTQALQSVAKALAALPTTAQTVGGKSIPVPLSALTLPLSPEILNQMVNAANIPGTSRIGVWKLTVTVPAGQTVVVTVPVLPGTVAVFAAPLIVTATYYSSQIIADVWVDGNDVTPYPEYQITGDDQIEFGQYYYMRIGMQGTITNNSPTTTVITFKVEVMAIQQDFFESFYVPLIQHSVDSMKLLADIVTGRAG
jgi:hypothetical protein